jgi:ATP-dependent 26S proteasome regulatory subunit
VQVDPSVTFDQVGGMEQHVRALKEMIFLPLVYPELFERFHISPPRGVLFYGPPGVLSCCSWSFAAERSKPVAWVDSG